MKENNRIRLTKNQFADLISEVDGLCPLCSAKLIPQKGKNKLALCEAAHIYPHSPTAEETALLADVPRLSDSNEDVSNLILLCPNCHQKFDHPRTKEEYLELYRLKKLLSRRKAAAEYYQSHCLETDIINVLKTISEVDALVDCRKLSYYAITVKEKMDIDASIAIKNIVSRDVYHYYVPIRDALVQIEAYAPGSSDLIAKEISLFYTKLKIQGFTQDEIYYAINEWIDARTQHLYSAAIPWITAYYVQNCEVFS